MPTIHFDDVEREITDRRADRWAIAACVAACAQRLYPQFAQFCQSRASEAERFAAVTEAVNQMWTCIASRSVQEIPLRETLRKCEGLVVDEDAANAAGHPYAADAVAVVVYCLRFLCTNQTQVAIWGARRLYEAVDNSAIQRSGIDVSSVAGEVAALEDHMVQRELGWQLRDLREAAGIESGRFAAVCSILRERATVEGASVFLSFTNDGPFSAE